MKFDYDDGTIACGRDGIYIRNYYFPSRRTKKLSWADIETLERRSLGVGRLRLWGMGLSPEWFHLDILRPTKAEAIVLRTGSFVSPVITPQDPDKVFALIKRKLSVRLSESHNQEESQKEHS